MPSAEFPPDVAGLLDRLRDMLAKREDIVGVYVSGSLVTGLWLEDSWVDHGLVVLPRAEALLTTGDLITKSEAISQLAGFGVPEWLVMQVRDRRDGQPVTAGPGRRLTRAMLTRRIMQRGIARLGRLTTGTS
jgi:hypothetical protein